MYSPLFKILQVFSNIYGCILIDRIFEEEKKTGHSLLYSIHSLIWSSRDGMRQEKENEQNLELLMKLCCIALV